MSHSPALPGRKVPKLICGAESYFGKLAAVGKRLQTSAEMHSVGSRNVVWAGDSAEGAPV